MVFSKIVLAAACIAGTRADGLLETFTAYKKQHGKVYLDETEESLRMKNFAESLEMVKAHNEQDHSWKMGINQFSDMSDEEFKAKVLMKPQECSATAGNVYASAPRTGSADLPAHVDWREKGVVSEVKNQGHCGSCWTFSTVGALEAHMALKYDNWRAPRLSEQQLIECAGGWGNNHGCEGGLPSNAFEYVKGVGGLSTEFSYPYVGKDGPCKMAAPAAATEGGGFMPTSAGIGVVAPGGSVNITQGDEMALKYYVATRGPVSIAYQVASDFRHYAGGVYSSTVCKNTEKDVNHAVLVVGYGTDTASGKDYWTIKNSWDYSFGVEGFFKMEAFKNMCGIANCMAFPDLYGINEQLRVAQQPVTV
mmetsp:Transcript_45727/g.83757  ORF Transcript_45727/g.83757 Transcript_45727/m.83757 type:complete len:364 (+) Transcript_45727:70-1161(+)